MQILGRLALVVVVGRSASAPASAASTAAASSVAAAAAAACEAGEPSPSLVRVRPGSEVVARIGSAPAADIPREVTAGAGPGAAGLWRGGALLLDGFLGFGGQVCLHPLRQLDGHLRVSSLGTVNRIVHPVRYHCVQHLVSGGVLLTGQEVAGTDDGAAGELDADRLPDQVQLVHDVKDTLSGGGVLDDEVDAVCFAVTTGNQNVPRERSEDVDFPLPAQLHYLLQNRVHRPELRRIPGVMAKSPTTWYLPSSSFLMGLMVPSLDMFMKHELSTA